MDCFSFIFSLYTFSVMLYLRGHQQFVMRCGFLLVEGCMVTCLVFNSEDYYCVICWLFEDTLRTDSTFCGDMAIWEQETGVLYQVAVYGDKGKISRPTWTVCWLHAWKTRDIHVYMGEVSMINHHINNVASYCC
jgi:hypothetical protein